MEIEKTLNSQSNLKKEKQKLKESGSLTLDYTTSYSNQNKVWYWHKNQNILHRSMQQNRKSREKPTQLWSINLGQRRQDYTMEKRHSPQ